MVNWKRYINISPSSYWYIRYIGGNVSTDYFFLNKHPSANMRRLGELHMPSGVASNWYFLSVGQFVKIDTNHYLFSKTQTWKINNHFFYRIFSNHFLHRIFSISICLSWKFKVLLKIIANHYLFSWTGKINNHFFQEKNEKMWICYNRCISKNISIYTNMYTYTSIYIDIFEILIYHCHP